MWVYEVSTGWLTDPKGQLAAVGYSGATPDKNQVVDEDVEDMGPIPEGEYEIGAPVDTESHGPYVLELTPAPTNREYGRSGFLIHGDSLTQPGTASKGCIVLPHAVRVEVWESGDHQLSVVA